MKHRAAGRLVIIGGSALAAAWLLVIGVMMWRENSYIFFPARYPDAWQEPSLYNLEYEDILLPTADGGVHGWWLPRRAGGVTILMLHGNAGHIATRLELLTFLFNMDDRIGAICIIDYPGYGRSGGTPGEAGCYRAAAATYQHLMARGISPDRLIIHGRSLGAAVALETALHAPAAGLVMECPFLSIPRLATELFPIPGIGLAVRQRFDNEAKMPALTMPLLLIHGDRDSVIPVRHSQRLATIAPAPHRYLEVPGADHGDCHLVGGNRYIDAWRWIIERAAGG
ncbi:alpha/beta hydrolase [bacterium]|nr:alpha/beta hydrolase [candidate division CSSED10-310 bacterium]